MPRVTLMLQPSASQQADLEQLLAAQQDPFSPDYHRWLTPEEFADRFGVSPSDLHQIVAWLQSQQLTVVGVARARNWIAVSGTAGAIGQAFGTRIHRYLVNGELHYANAAEPSLPASLQGVVTAIHGLTDFRWKPALRRGRVVDAIDPQYTNPSLCSGSIAPSGHCIGPDDLAAIYNITPLYNNGFSGGGQRIVIVGQTDIRLADITEFRSFYNLPPINLQQILVPGSPDPGVSSGDLGEADLDLELSGAVARNATIDFVYSTDVFSSAQYAIDLNLAPVLSMSYGACEAGVFPSDAMSLQAMAQQANAQGITWFASSGDSGATGCYGDGSGMDNAISVSLPASLPGVTGIGGTEFNEGTGNYWNAANNANNASALSYIPETSWNDTALDGTPTASGGGASVFFGKPSWQTGTGVPYDGARDVPDLSLSASADHDGYLIFSSDVSFCGLRQGTGPCQVVVGGTSAGAPAYSGIAALLNQAIVAKGLQPRPGMGTINPALYSLRQSAPAAFHDVTSGNNVINITCRSGATNCTPGPAGYYAGPGYDQVTGLGSVDAYALMTAWSTLNSSQITPPPVTPAPLIEQSGSTTPARLVLRVSQGEGFGSASAGNNQLLNLSVNAGALTNASITPATTSGGSWLGICAGAPGSCVPGTAALASQVLTTATTVYTVGVNTLNLTAGKTYSGTVNVAAAGSTPLLVPVSVVVLGPNPTGVGIYRSSNGLFILNSTFTRTLNGADRIAQFTGFGFTPQPTDIPVTGDWSGTGTARIGLYRPSTGTWFLDYNGNGVFDGPLVDRQYQYGGLPGDIPVVGDWDGSGYSKVGLFRAGFLFVLNTSGSGASSASDSVFAFGGLTGCTGHLPGYFGNEPAGSCDVPIVGDWNQSGTTKVGVVRAAPGSSQPFLWILDTNGTHVPGAIFPFGGVPGDIPIVGDWSNTGNLQVGVFRSGFFWVQDTTANLPAAPTATDTLVAFPYGGVAGDVPVVGHW